MSMIVRKGKGFIGNVYTDPAPLPVTTGTVQRVHMFDVPASLREHAVYALGDLSGGQWWTVGEFRYTDSPDYETAVARRVGAQVQYGIGTGE